MNFAYSSVISVDPDSGDYLLFRRPEIPITIRGPKGAMSLVGLVDTGSDNTVFPKSAADYLGIPISAMTVPTATAFGGQPIPLLFGEAVLRLQADEESLAWHTHVNFFDFDTAEEEVVILGHAGFLEFFTATFDGQQGMLTLVPNDDLPADGV